MAEFGWYKDSRRVIYATAPSEEQKTTLIKVADLQTARSRVLLEMPNNELAAAPDGSGLTFCSGESHTNTNLWLLRLDGGEDADGLPTPAGPPEQLTDGGSAWHAHNGGWSVDGKSIVYIREAIEADIYLLQDYR